MTGQIIASNVSGNLYNLNGEHIDIDIPQYFTQHLHYGTDKTEIILVPYV